MLARGELRMIGATTLDEYRERIEKDAALERRFQQVIVDEPSVEDTIAILRGLKGRYEAHHQVQISDAALVAAASLSDRYITARFLPDKAIDLIDESASRLRMEIDSRPVEIDELQRTVDRMLMEELALKQEEDAASKERLERLRRDLADRQEQLAALVARWDREKAGLNKVGELKKQLDDLKGQAERAQRDADFESASRLMYGDIPALEREIAAAPPRPTPSGGADGEAAQVAGLDERPMVKEEVGPDDIAERRVVLDRDPGGPAAGGRDRQAAADGNRARPAARRPGEGRPGRLRRGAAVAGRHLRPRPAVRLVPVPRADRRRQDRAGQGARGVPVRRRAGHHPDRHERVLRAALGGAPGRGTARLRRLRGGRPAHRGGPAAAVLRRAARRGGEGPPGGLRHPAPGAGRRAAHRRAGPHRRLPQHDPDPDLQPGLAVHRRTRT